jgi:hypothetical protein
MDNISEEVILKLVQRYIEERGLFNASMFGFLVRHSTTLQCMRLTDQVALNFTNNNNNNNNNNHNISTAAVFLDIEKKPAWNPDLLYKLFELKISDSLLKPIRSFLSQRKSEFW